MNNTPAAEFLDDARAQFRKTRELADGALAQVSDQDFFASGNDTSNAIAAIVKHLAGNMRSRWTDFLTADGEKPNRHRDREFVIDSADTRDDLMRRWETGWAALFGALDPLTEADLVRTITIRGEPHSVVKAINRQLTHYSYHVGQIVYLARYFAGDTWTTLSVAKGRSKEFNEEMRRKHSFRA